MRIAIMQPYFMPYAGYFRLMEAADLFVIYDCVQFPRRGWVHRNKLHNANGNSEWLTLPLAKADRDSTRIQDLQFADNAQNEWEARMDAFPALKRQDESGILDTVKTLHDTPCGYISGLLQRVCERLGITCAFTYSSALNLPPSLKHQERILAIAEHFKANTYINAPGGRELYLEEAFASRGINLRFLPDYQGNLSSILERLLLENTADITREIQKNIEARD